MKPTAAPMKGAVHGVATTDGEDAGEERVGVAAARAQRLEVIDCAKAPHSKTPGEVEREHEEERGEQRHHHRRLQLEAPAELGAAGAQRRA